MNRARIIAIADRAAPAALKLIAAANVFFLGAFLIALHAAVSLAE